MKTANALPTLAMLASVAAAATSVSDCAQMCLDNMRALAPSLGCTSGDVACLCANRDFEFGIHDCTVEACPNDNVDEVVAYARTLCNAQVSGSDTQSSDGATQTETRTGDNIGVGGGATTSPIVTTITSESSTIVSTIGSTTIPAGGIITSESSTAAPNTTTTTETLSTTTSTSTSTSTSSETGGGAGAGGATETSTATGTEVPAGTTGAAVPIATIDSGAAGIIGLAALLLL
ncbi:hypothetical protein VTN49DRAFT_3144 [Thermomyces lanuginosus]|uniref:uncharacterized protein n=1 Tax=Thermomyces lanuginosus TaxID=5541 RepID=UPI0037441B4E